MKLHRRDIYVPDDIWLWMGSPDRPCSKAAMFRIAVKRLRDSMHTQPITADEVAWAKKVYDEGEKEST